MTSSTTDKRLARLTIAYGARVRAMPDPAFDPAALTPEEQYDLDGYLARDGHARPGETWATAAGPLTATERGRMVGMLARCAR